MPLISKNVGLFLSRKLQLILFLFLAGMLNFVFGQTVTIAGWDVSGQSSYGTSPLAATTIATNTTVGNLTKGSGLLTGGTAASRAWGYGTATTSATTTSSATAITNNSFFTFTVKANTGYSLSLSAISTFDYRRSTNGAQSGLLQYQINSGSFVDIATVSFSSSSSGGASIASTSLSGISALQNLPASSTITFRCVLYNGSNSGAWYLFDKSNSSSNDFVVTGTVSSTSSTVTFNANGGTGSMSDQTASSATALTSNAFTRTGYTFAGWNTAANGSGTAYSNGASYSFASSTTLYAQWTANTLNVTFDSQGGSAVSSTTTTSGGTVAYPGTPTRAGYTFNGWFVAASGGTAISWFPSYSHGQTSDFTLYAQWTANTFNVTYDSRGGSAISSTTTETGGSLSNPGTPTRAGYTFNGWFVSSSGGTAISFPYTHNEISDFTLYAQWTANTLTVTFNSQGGSSISSTTTTTGGTMTNPGTPTRAGYTFNGWFVASSGGTAILWFPSYSHGQTSDFTLYAQWTANTLTVTYDSQGGSTVSNGSTTTGGTVSDPGSPTRTGYTFNGWFIAASGGSALSFPYSHGQTSDFTLYAQWTVAGTPTINSATLSSALTSTYGTASTGIGSLISGSNLTGNILVTAQSGYEVSTTLGSGYSSSVSVASGTTVYFRFASTKSAGTYNSEICAVLTSSGASSVNVLTSVSGNTISPKTLSITSASIASKVYDGSNSTGTITIGSLSGFVGSETVVVSSYSGTYLDANVGTGKIATISYTLGNGTNGGLATNYSLSSTTALGDITSKALSITTASIASKVYDGSNSTGSVTAGTLSGFVGSETVVVNTASGNFLDANVGTGKSATISYTLGNGTNGGLATNYSLANTSTTGNITAKSLSITAASIASKMYDGTTATGTVTPGTLSGFIGAETIIVSSATGVYASPNVGTGKSANISYVLGNGTNGGLATNYSLSNTTSTGNITAKTLSITSASVASKVYDGSTTTGTITAGSLSGFIGSETVVINTTTGTFSDANVGNGKTATISYTLSNGTNGGLATNYTLASTTSLGDITSKALTITANNVSKEIGTSLTSGTGSTAFTSSGLISGQTIGSVTITYGTGAAASDAVGTYTGQITPSSATGGTFSAANYSISYVAGTLTVQNTSAVILATIGTSATENFNSLANSGTSSTTPTGWYFSESGSNSNSTYTAGTGSSATGDTYSFGASSNSDRALGSLLSGSLTSTFGGKFLNTTGSTVNNLFISYTGETWRVGAASRSDRLDFQYSLNATSLSTGTWTDFNGLDYANTGQSTASGSMLQSSNISDVITGLSLANGASIWIRWNDFDASGSDDGMAVDEFSIKPCGTVSAPTASTQAFCSATSPTVAGLAATGTSIQWYAASSGGSALSTSTALSTGTYYATQTISGCESSSRTSVAVTVNTSPSVPTASAQDFCSTSSPTIASLTATGSAIQWYAASSGGSALASSTALSSGTYYATQTVTGCESATRTSVSVTVFTSGTWIGDASGNWNNASNWCGGIPADDATVIIPSNVTITVDASPKLSSLTIGSGAVLNFTNQTITFNNGATITNNGTINSSTESWVFLGDASVSGAITMYDVSLAGTVSFSTSPTVSHSLTLNANGLVSGNAIIYGSNATLAYNTGVATTTSNYEWPATSSPENIEIKGGSDVTLNADKTISGTLALTGGTLIVGANTLTYNGTNITRTSGSIDASNASATLAFGNSSLLTLPASVFSAAVNNMTLNNARVLVSSDFTINGILNLNNTNPDATNGLLDLVQSYGGYANVHSNNSTDSYNDLNSVVLTLGSSATLTGTGDVTGKIRRTSFSDGTTYAFGNPNMRLTFNQNGGTMPSQITVVATKGTEGLHVDKDDDNDNASNPLIGGKAVKRMHQILRTGGTNDVRFTVRFPYDDSELNGNTESNLVTWDHHLPYAGMTPHEHGKTNINTTENWVELSNHGLYYLAQEGDASFTKYWMLSNKVSTDTLWLGAAGGTSGTDWSTGINWSSGAVPSSITKVVVDPTIYNNQLTLTGTPSVGTVYIKSGGVVNAGSATLTLNGGPAINGGSGTWVNEGTFNAESSTVVINYADATIAGTTEFNNLTINSGKLLTAQSDAVVKIKGTLANNGTLDATSNANTIEYTGSNQTIHQPNGTIPGYYHLAITQASGDATLSETIKVKGNLIMNNGNVITDDSKLLEVGADKTNTGGIIWNNGTIVGPLKRWFSTTPNASQASGIFPVGLSNLNRYAQVNFTETTEGGYVIVKYHTGKPQDAYSNFPLTNNETNYRYIQNADTTGYWEMTPYDESGMAYGALNTKKYKLRLRINTPGSIENAGILNDPPALRLVKAPGNNADADGHGPWEPAGTFSTLETISAGTDYVIESNDVTGFSWFNGGGNNANPLPVELLNFSAECSEKGSLLTWQTASENNSDYFLVQESMDGLDWSVSGKVQAAGNSTEKLDYQFELKEKSTGETYYRLLQFDNDGASKMYGPIMLNCSENKDEVTVYPNPSKDEVYLSINTSKEQTFKVSTSDASGKIIDSFSTKVAAGTTNILINRVMRIQGVYFITVEDEIGVKQTTRHIRQ